MSLDLNGSAITGNNYVTSYAENLTAVAIVSSAVRVGNGSTTQNTDGIHRISISGNWGPGDMLQISTLPAGLELSGGGIPSGATSWSGNAPSMFYIVRTAGGPTVSDAAWQNALLTVSFSHSSPGNTAPTRTITINAENSAGSPLSTASTTINVDNAPTAGNDTASATEAGGVNNSSGGSPATGTVLVNDNDPDVSDSVTVSAVRFGSTNGTVGSALAGAYGSLVLNANGQFTYNVNNSSAAVQALRPSQGNLTDTFTYTIVDEFGATATATLTVNIGGTNDAPVAVADIGTAIEAGGVNNLVPGANATGNVLANAQTGDTDVDANEFKAVTQVSFGSTNGTVGLGLNGAYGSLVLNVDGNYTYTVNNANAAVQALGVGQTLTDTFTYTMRDQAGATSGTTLTITVQGADDAPGTISLGHWFNGTAGAVVSTPQLLDAYSDFTLEFKVTPTEAIALHAESNTGAAGTAGQHYAVAASQGQATWGSTSHAGIGVSVGTNGITVYQHTANVLSPLLTWGGTVGPETRVAIVFDDNTPGLYINGTLVRTGLASTVPNLHPSLNLGGDAYGYFNGTLSDYRVWDSALSVAQIGTNLTRGVSLFDPGLLTMPILPTSVTEPEQPYGFTVIGSAHSVDPEGHTVTYSLQNDAGGRFVINATTGEISVASGAQFDYEANTYHDIVVRASANGAYTQSTLRVGVANLVEAPVAVADTGTATEAGTQAGGPAQGNVLLNDVAMEADGVKTVIAVGDSEAVLEQFVGQPLQGLYGTLTLDADGDYEYVVDNNNPAVQALGVGQTLSETFAYRVSGNDHGTWTSSTLTLTIQGANDAPVAVADTAVAVEAGGVNNDTPGANPTGNVLANDTDVDGDDTKTVSTVSFGASSGAIGSALAGAYGSLLLNADGSYTYTVDNNNATVQALRTSAQTLTDTFTYTVWDAAGVPSTSTLAVTIQGANDTPVAVADTIHVQAGGTNNSASINRYTNDTDVDAGDSKLSGSWSGNNSPYGTAGAVTGGGFTFTVNNDNAAVRALRTYDDTLTATYTYWMQDSAGAVGSSTVDVTIHGANDAPSWSSLGTWFDGTAGSVVNPQHNLGAYDNFTLEFKVTPTEAIGLHAQSTGGAAGTSGQHYAIWAPQGQTTWGSAAHMGIGVSVGTNGISVYQHTANVLAPLLTWSGSVSAETQVAVVFNNKTPTLYVNGTAVHTGLQSAATYLHPSTVVGGGQWGNFRGSVSDYNVWDSALSAAQVNTNLTHGLSGTEPGLISSQLSTTVVENAAAGTVVGTAHTWDVDAGDTRTYSLLNDAGGRFAIDANTGVISVASGAVLDHEAAGNHNLTVRATDGAGLHNDQAIRVRVANANDAPVAHADVADVTAASAASDSSAPDVLIDGNVLTDDDDVDAGDTKRVIIVDSGPDDGFVGQPLNGLYGTLTLEENGQYSYALHSNNPVVRALRTGDQTLTDTFYYTMQDAEGLTSNSTLTITIHGTNDAPVAHADIAEVTAAAPPSGAGPGFSAPDVTIDGNVLSNDSDDDAGDSMQVIIVDSGPDDGIVGQPLNGLYGTIVLQANGHYTYTVHSNNAAVRALRPGDAPLTDTFYYTMQDAAGATSDSTLTVSIYGANDAPVAQADVNDVTAAPAVGGTALDVALNGNVLANDEDPDTTDTKTVTGWFAQSLDGGYGSLQLNADGSYTYTLHSNNAAVRALRPNGPTLSESFVYYMRDAAGETSASTLTITIHGANDAPVAHADIAEVTAGAAVNGNPAPDVTIDGNVLTNDHDDDAGDSMQVIVVDSGPDDGIVGQPLNGLYGTLVLQANGHYTYTVHGNNAAVQALTPSSQPLADTFYYTVRDAAGATSNSTLTVSIHGVNDAPVALVGAATMAEDTFFSITATTMGLVDLGNGPVTAVRIDSVPSASQGSLTLNGQPVSAGQVMSAEDAATLLFKPNLFSLQAFGITDVDAGDSIQAVRIDSLPNPLHGELTLDGEPVTAGQLVPVAALGDLSFEPVEHYNGTATFTYSVRDQAGEFSAPSGTFSIAVTAVNDTPSIDPLLALDVLQGVATKLAGLHFSDADSGSAPITVTLRVAAGTLTASGTSLVAVTGSGSDTVTLTGSLGDINEFVDSGSGVSVTAPVYAPPSITATMQLVDANDTSENPQVRLVMTTTQGNTFTADGEAGIQISGSGTSEITVVGLASAVTTYVNTERKVTHHSPADGINLEIKVDDLGHEGADPGLTGGPTNEEAWRGVTLFAVPQGMALREPITTSTHPDTGEGLSPVALAGLGVGATLVIGLVVVRDIFGNIVSEVKNRIFPRPEAEPAYTLFTGEPPAPTVPMEPVLPAPPPPPTIIGGPLLGSPFAWLIGAGTALLGLIAVLAAYKATHGDTNDTPTIDPLSSLDVNQDRPTAITGLHFADGDAQQNAVQVTLTLPSGSGTLAATAGAGVQVSGSGTGQLMLVGSVDSINAFIASSAVTYTTAEHATGQVALQVNINDLGNTGTDPGTTGGASDEQANLTVELDIQPVNHAPSGQDTTLVVLQGQPRGFTVADFGFADPVEGNSLAGVFIITHPMSGSLTLDGTEVVAGQYISAAEIQGGRLLFTPATHGNAQDSTSFTFQVQDNGGTANGGVDLDPTPRTITIDVDHAAVLATTTASFEEGQALPAYLTNDASITDVDEPQQSIATVRLTVVVPRLGDGWALDAVHFANAYEALHPGQTAPTVSITSTGANSYELTFSSGSVSAAAAQALIESLVFRSDSPNLDEGTREFSVQLVDDEGLASIVSTASVEVHSLFGELSRALSTQLQSIAGYISQTGSPVASFAADQHHTVMQWLAHREQLAEAVWNALSKAPAVDGLIGMGGSLLAALDTLRVDYVDAEVNLTPTMIDRLSEADDIVAVDADSGTVRLSPATQLALLKQLAAIRDESSQQRYFELANALSTAEEVGAAGAWQVAGAAWMVSWLDAFGIVHPTVQQSTDPQALLTQDVSALVQDAAGNLWATEDTLKQLWARIDTHRVNVLGKNSSYVELAGYLLAQGSAHGTVWAVDPSLEHWLDAASIDHGDVIELAANDNPLAMLLEPGSLGLTTDGKLVMSPTTLDALTEALATAANTEGGSTTAASELRAILVAATGSNGVYTLSAEQADLLEEAGVYFREVTALTSSSLAGEVAQANPDGAVTFTAQTRIALLTQLEAIEDKADALPANAVALSGLVQMLETLQRATGTTFYGKPLKHVAVSDELLAALASQGYPVEDLGGFSAVELDLIVPARFQAGAGVGCVYKIDDALLVPADLVDALMRNVARDLQFLGLDLGTATVPAFDASPQVNTDHAEQFSDPQSLALGKASRLVHETARALDDMVESSTQRSFTTTSLSQFEASVFDVDALRFKRAMARAGIALLDLGDAERLTTAQLAALQNAALPAMSRDADGSLVLSQATADALQTRLTAQYFRERADLAQSTMGILLQNDADAHLSVVQADGSLDHTLASATGSGLVVVSDGVLSTLALLGITALNLHARTSQPTVADVVALQATDGLFILDEADQTLVMSADTYEALLQHVATQIRASQVAYYSNDAAAITDGRYGTASDMAFNAIDAAAVGSALASPTQQVGDIVEVAIDSALLSRLRLTTFDAGRFDGSAAAQQALTHARLGTVQADGAGQLWMTAATRDWLVHQLEMLQDTSVSPFDASEAGARVAELNHLLDQVRDVLVPEGPFVTLFPDGQFIQQLATAGIVVDDLGAFDPEADPATYALSTQTNAIAHGADGEVIISAATHLAWIALLSAAASSAGGDLSGHPSFDLEGLHRAAVLWQAQTEEVDAFDALEVQLTPLLVGSNVVDVQSSNGVASIWRAPVGDSELSVAALVQRLAGTVEILDLGTLDASATSTIDALLDPQFVSIARDSATGELLMSLAARQTVVNALAAEIAQARQAICAHVVQELLAATARVDGVLVLRDPSVVQALERLGLHDFANLVPSDQPAFGELGIDGGSAVLLTHQTRLHLIAQIGAMEALPSATQSGAAALRDALKAVDSDGDIVEVPAGVGLSLSAGLLSLRDGGSYVDTKLGQRNLLAAPPGTVQVDADGTLYMGAATFAALQAELGGVVGNGWGSAAVAPDSAGYLQGAAQLLSYLEELATVRSVAPAADDGNTLLAAHVGWWDVFRSWVLEPATSEALQHSLGVSGGLDDQAQAFGIQFNVVTIDTDLALATALQDGTLQQPFTVVVDAGGNRLISAKTRDSLIDLLVDLVKGNTGVDWSELYGSEPASAGNAFAVAMGIVTTETHSGSLRRSLEAAPDDDWRAVGALARAIIAELQLDHDQSQLGGEVYGASGTGSKLDQFNLALQKFSGLQGASSVALPTNGTIADGEFATLGTGVLLTEQTRLSLLQSARLAAVLSDMEAGLRVTEALVRDFGSSLTPSLVSFNVSELDTGPLRQVRVTALDGSKHDIPYEQLLDVFVRYQADKNESGGISFGDQAMNYTDPVTLQLVTVYQQEVLDAYDRLNNGTTTYALGANGTSVVMSQAARDVVLVAESQDRQAGAGVLADLLDGVLDAAQVVAQGVTIAKAGFTAMLEGLGLYYFLSDNVTNVSLPRTIVDQGDRFLLTVETLDEFQAKVDAIRGSSTATVSRALTELAESAPIYANSDFFRQTADIELFSRPAVADGSSKLLVVVYVAPDYLARLQAAQIVPAAPTNIGALESATNGQLMGLWDTGQIRTATDSQGRTVLVMTVETQAWIEDKLDSGAMPTQHGLRNVGDDFVGNLLVAGLRVDVVDHLRVNGTSKASFLDPVELDKVLDQQPPGTVFVDTDGKAWISGDTAASLRVQLHAALRAASGPVVEVESNALSTKLLAYDAVLPVFNGTALIAPANGTSPAVVRFDADHLGELSTLGITLTEVAGNDTSALASAPPLSYMLDDAGNATISASTYAALSSQLPVAGYALRSSLFQNEWTRFNYTGVDGQNHSYWQSVEGQDAHFAEALAQGQLVVPNQGTVNGTALDGLTSSTSGYMVDQFGHVIVSDATFGSIQPALALISLASRAEFASAVDAAQQRAQTHHARNLVLVTDTALIMQVVASGKTKEISSTPDADNLTGDERQALAQQGAYGIDSSGHLLMTAATRDWLGALTADGIPALAGNGTAIAAVPDVVEIKGSTIVPYLKSLLGVSLGGLLDDAQQPMTQAQVDGGNLSDAARRQLADADRLVVLDKDGDLIMSADTWKTLVTSGRQSFAAAGGELSQELIEQLGLAAPSAAVQSSDGTAQQVRTLQGPYMNWLKAFDAAGVGYSFAGNVVGSGGNYTAALFASPDTPISAFALGTDATGRVVLSEASHTRLMAYMATIEQSYRAAHGEVLASIDPTLPTDLSWFAAQTGLKETGDTLSHSGAASRIRETYTMVTNMRFMLNSGLYTDGDLLVDHYKDAVADLLTQLSGMPADKVETIYKTLQGYVSNDMEVVMTMTNLNTLTAVQNFKSQFEQELTAARSLIALGKDDPSDILAVDVSKLETNVKAAIARVTELSDDLERQGNLLTTIAEKLGAEGADLGFDVGDGLKNLPGLIRDAAERGNYARVEALVNSMERAVETALEENVSRADTASRGILKTDASVGSLADAAANQYKDEIKGVAVAHSTFSQQLQMMRAITSYITYVTAFAGKAQDAVLAHQQAGSVLGTSQAAQDESADYIWTRDMKIVNAVQNFVSPTQLVVHYLHKKGFQEGWGKFKDHFGSLFTAFPQWTPPYVSGSFERSSLGELVKDTAEAMEIKDRNKLAGWPWAVHVTQNSVYTAADLAWFATGVVGLMDVTRGGLPAADASALKNARFTTDFALALADSVIAPSWAFGDGTALFTAGRRWNQIGSRAIGLPLHVYLPLYAMDAAIATAEWKGNADGSGWGTVADKWINTGLYAMPYFLPSTAGFSFMLQLIRPSFAALENAWAKNAMADELATAGRMVEAAVMRRQAAAEMVKFYPVAGWFSWAYNVYHGNDTSMTREEYEQATREIFEFLDLPAAPDRPADAIAALAKQWGVAENFYHIVGGVADFPFTTTDNIQVIKAGVVHHVVNGVSGGPELSFYDHAVDIGGTANNFYNDMPIKVSNIDNRTGSLATYLIDKEVSVNVAISGEAVPGPNLEIDVSHSTADSVNQFIVNNPQVIIRGGASTDIYFLTKEMETVYSAGQRISGYIEDGAHSAYRDVVSFARADGSDGSTDNGHFIHSGRGYKGFTYYDGIYQFAGSLYNDVFTRYGSGGASDTWVYYEGTGGSDMFDLRSGNNDVTLSSGTVRFDGNDAESAWANAAGLKQFTDTEKLQFLGGGPFEGDAAAYAGMFLDRFTADNNNVVALRNNVPGSFAVYGNALAYDTINFGGWTGEGLHITPDAQNSSFVVRSLSSVATYGTFDGAVDRVDGTIYADVIQVGQESAVKQIVGGGGDDRITVNKVGVSVVTYEGNSLVTLEAGSRGASVAASGGTTVVVKTDAAAAPAPEDRVNVGIAGTPGGSDVPSRPVVVNASEAHAELYADMFTGSAHVTVGRDDSTVVINATADHVTIVDNGQRAGTLEIKFLDEGGDFDVGQLIAESLDNVSGSSGQYHATWQTASGRLIDLDIHYSNTLNINLWEYDAATSTSLGSLVAELTPQPAP